MIWKRATICLCGLALLTMCGSAGAEEPPCRGDKNEAVIRAALAKPFQADYDQTPLNKIVKEIADKFNITVLIDTRALDGVGLDSDTPMTLHTAEISLDSVLRHLLKELELTYMISDEALLITTPDEAEGNLILEIYPVGDLLPPVPAGELVYRDWGEDRFAEIEEIIQSTSAPDSWDSVGGPASIKGMSMGGRELLFVSQTEEVHRAIACLLERIRKQPAAPIAAVEPVGKPRLMVFRLTADAAKEGQTLVSLISRRIEPASWTAEGVSIEAAAGAIVVRHTPAVHQQIGQLLKAMNVLTPTFDYYQGGNVPVVGSLPAAANSTPR
ncbi:hypothetical protein [Lignipirellula cremea]|uniref:NolW-like domain-containing protein n=1 Tax=Lignipirellula cremea TaxID=2528010 RepID=A0A518E4T2_9BACT|nr:hypothetical protein [Lignipirellula cremea]QDU99096.1 hypothetical protein Pla8534_70070 [Lignipirellula cremea]